MRSLTRLLILTAVCTCGASFFSASYGSCLLAAAETPALTKSPDGHIVHKIHFEVVGAQEHELSESQAMLKNLKIREGLAFSQADFDQDLKFLAKEFDKIEPSISMEHDQVDVFIKAWKKPMITSITFEGNTAFDSRKLLKESALQTKTLLDRHLFYKAIQKIKTYYVKRGYFEIEITPVLREHDDGRSVEITLQMKEGRAGFIEKIRFHNVTKREKELILDRMMTQEYNWWISWLTGKGTYYADVFRQDEMMILSHIQNEGFLDARVSYQLRQSDRNRNRIVIDISVDRGKEYFFGNIHFDADQKIFTKEQLFAKTGLTPGAHYSPEEIRMATRRLYDAFGAKGYIDTAVVPEMKLVPQAGDAQAKEGITTPLDRTYDVTFKIHQGTLFRVGLIRIIGNKQTDASVILHETPLVPGATFDATLLAKTEEKLRNIGYFKSVNVYAVKSETASTESVPLRDVHIEVEENSTTAQFQLFGGFNTTEGISGGVNLSESNFKMKGVPDIFSDGMRALRGGGEYLGFNATIGAKVRSYTLSWTKPYFLDTKWALGVDLQKKDNAYAASDYTIKSKEATISLRRPLNAFVSFSTHYRLRDSHIDLKNVHHTQKNRELIRESKNGGVISAIGAALSYDSTNHPVNPSTGARSSLGLEYAGIFGDHRFVNMAYLNTLFFPCGERGVIKLKGNLQLIATLFGTHPRKLPMDERLYLGGEGSIRGFRYNTVGPAFRDSHHTPRGGLTSLLFSGEYEKRLAKQLSGFVFVDSGDVWWKTLEFGSFVTTTGFGIRFYITENAPLTVGYGIPLTAKNSRNVQKFYFSIGATF